MLDDGDRAQFERIWARKLETALGTSSYIPGENLRVDKALQSFTRGARLLDIGCGDGMLAMQAREKFSEVHGIDISRAAVEIAMGRNVQALVVNLNSEALPYAESFFDTITILSTLQYFYDLDHVLIECHRVLIPGGNLLLSVPNMRAFWRVGKLLFQGSFPRVSKDVEGYDGGTLHYFAFSNLQELLNRHDFIVKAASGIFCLPRFIERFADKKIIGLIKREFFSAEIFIHAQKSNYQAE